MTSKHFKYKVFATLFLPLCFAIRYAPDLQGNYCQNRKDGCCRNRRDECSYPIRDTLCYCDEFCENANRPNDDCCPDYWSYCKGAPTEIKQGCSKDGQWYNEGTTIKDNCNNCKCQRMNETTEFLCEVDKCLVDDEIVTRINRDYRLYGFTAEKYPQFLGKKYEEGKSQRFGVLHSRKQVLQMQPIKNIIDFGAIPKEFDARRTWAGRISPPKDQGWCGASWVFSTVAVASDRFAIMTRGNDNTFLSPQHLLNCNSRNQRGCRGGHLTRAWTFIRKFGLVPDDCYPWEGVSLECRIPRRTKDTETHCPNTSLLHLKKGKLHRVGPVYRISTEEGIMNEILHSGPVQAIIKVSRDFFSYKEGIFRCTSLSTEDRNDYHAVRIVGWGEKQQNNQAVKFWIVSNSWGTWWGENGYFRIRKGTNECLIEEFVIAAWAKTDNLDTTRNTTRLLHNFVK